MPKPQVPESFASRLPNSLSPTIHHRTYFIFYRNLFARLKDPTQYLTVQILSSSWILIYYPISMSKFFYRILTIFFSYGKTYPDHLETVAHGLLVSLNQGSRTGSSLITTHADLKPYCLVQRCTSEILPRT